MPNNEQGKISAEQILVISTSKMKTFILSLTFILIIASCSRKPTQKTLLERKRAYLDSLFDYYTEHSTSPNYFILKIKQNDSLPGIAVCTETLEFGRLLYRNRMTGRLSFDSKNQPEIIDSAYIFRDFYHTFTYNTGLVDSLTIHLVPLIIDSIKQEARNNKYDTFWSHTFS